MQVLAAILVRRDDGDDVPTQRQLMSKNMPADALTGPYAQQQKMLLYVLPVVFAVGGIAFPIGVLFYWTTSNLWTMGQQFYVIRNNPAPGTAADEGEGGAGPGEGRQARVPSRPRPTEPERRGGGRSRRSRGSSPRSRPRAAQEVRRARPAAASRSPRESNSE